MLGLGNFVLLTIRFLDVATFTTLTPISLIISCKLSFPIIGLKTSSLITLALKSPKIIHTVFREFIEYIFQFFVEPVLHIINFILC
jgi:hypothetical protein